MRQRERESCEVGNGEDSRWYTHKLDRKWIKMAKRLSGVEIDKTNRFHFNEQPHD